jgi:hypothetical protein
VSPWFVITGDSYVPLSRCTTPRLYLPASTEDTGPRKACASQPVYNLLRTQNGLDNEGHFELDK